MYTAVKNAYARRAAKRRERGATLIEVAMYLTIAGIIIAGALLLYQSADANRKTGQALTQLAQIQNAVRTAYAGQPDYSAASTTDLVNANSLPASMISGTTIRHVFNSTVTVAAATASGGANSGFSVLFTNIPADACKAMLVKDLGRALFSAGGPGGVRTQATGLPFTNAQAAASCTGTYNDITWIFS